MLRKTLVLALVILVDILPATAAGLTPEQVVELRRVREIAAGPGGKIAFTVEVPRAADAEPGKAWRELWVASPGSEPRRWAGDEERVTDPQWSPDGRRISFLVDRGEDDRRELWVLDAAGGEARRVVDHAASIERHRWSPAGKQIAFVSRDAKTEKEREDEKAGRDWKVPDVDEKLRRVWLHDLDRETTTLWFEDDLDIGELAWLPSGEAIVFRAAETTRIDDEYMFSKLFRAERGGGPKVVADTEGKIEELAVSPDGRTLAYLGATRLNDPLPQSLFVVPAAGGTPRNLTAGLEASAAQLAWLDSRELLLVTVAGTRHALWRVNTTDGTRRPVEWPALVVHELDRHPAEAAFAVIADGARHPSELFRLDLPGEPERLTRLNPWLDEVDLARQEVVTWRGPGGLSIEGVLTWPLDHRRGERRPLVLQLHGGPEGVSLDGWTTNDEYPVQVLAARGFFVLQPNYRGSQGRGVAFTQADHDDLGGKEMDDVLAGIDHLIERGLVDADRVGTGGWSYGGYLSAWGATRHSPRFRAAVVAAGLTNWISFAGTTDIPHEMSLVHWDSWWFDEAELHWERSPLAHLDRARTPTLIVHGEADTRVHPEQSLELYTALRIKKVPARLVLYPREPHGLDERAHQLDFIERTVAWFEEHLETPPRP